MQQESSTFFSHETPARNYTYLKFVVFFVGLWQLLFIQFSDSNKISRRFATKNQ